MKNVNKKKEEEEEKKEDSSESSILFQTQEIWGRKGRLTQGSWVWLGADSNPLGLADLFDLRLLILR
jgi:hypothetical protein